MEPKCPGCGAGIESLSIEPPAQDDPLAIVGVMCAACHCASGVDESEAITLLLALYRGEIDPEAL